MGQVNIKNCQSAWNQHFGCLQDGVEVVNQYLIQFNLPRTRNASLCKLCICYVNGIVYMLMENANPAVRNMEATANPFTKIYFFSFQND